MDAKNGWVQERPVEPHSTSSDIRLVSDITLGQHRLSTYHDNDNGANSTVSDQNLQPHGKEGYESEG